MKFSELRAIFAQEQTNQRLLVIGIDAEGRQVEVLFEISTAPKAEWESVRLRYL